MLARKFTSLVFAVSLLLTLSQGRGYAAPRDVRGQSTAGARAHRITSQKKRSKQKKVNHTLKKRTARAAEGVWGGDHIRLVLTEGGATIEYDCAHGKIDEPLIADSEGRFDAKGTHVRESPGPIRVGITPISQSARYTGTIKDQTMTLTVTLTERGQTIGTYTLTRGSEGRIWKCR